MNTKLIEFIEFSFLHPLLSDKDITDISYNGNSIFYQHSQKGRKKADISASQNEVNDFLRQISNLSEQLFSYTNPVLDISVGKYRINAVHGSIGRINNDKTVTFSIRIASNEIRVKPNSDFMSLEVAEFLKLIISKHISVVVAGKTGSGKTELQKFLLTNVETNGRIIIIDNIMELDNIRINEDLDLTFWQVNERIGDGGFENLIRNAIRNNPDWLVVAEARGKEMASVLNAAMTGHPIITTIHAKSIFSVPHRMVRMALMGDKSATYDELLEDISVHFPIYVLLSREVNEQGVKRKIESIGEIHEEDRKVHLIYDSKKGFLYKNISNQLRKELEILDE